MVPRRLMLDRVKLPTVLGDKVHELLELFDLDSVMPHTELMSTAPRTKEVRVVGDLCVVPKVRTRLRNRQGRRRTHLGGAIGRYTMFRIFRNSTATQPVPSLLPRGLCVCREHANDAKCTCKRGDCVVCEIAPPCVTTCPRLLFRWCTQC